VIKFGPIKNIDKVVAFLRNLPRGTKREAVIGVAEYLVGDGSHGLSKDDPYRRTTRKAVYGRTFESDAQRRYVMGAIKRGEIVPGQRKYSPTRASEGYSYKLTSGGYGATITNTEEGAYWTRVWGGWKNWRSYDKVVRDNIKGAMRHAMKRVNDVLRSKGKK